MSTKKTYTVHQKVESYIHKEVEASSFEEAVIIARADKTKDWDVSNKLDMTDIDYYIVNLGDKGGVEFDEVEVARILEKYEDD